MYGFAVLAALNSVIFALLLFEDRQSHVAGRSEGKDAELAPSLDAKLP